MARTQVGIVGAGPSGLLLAHLLHEQGIESVVLENRTEEYVIARVRAGVLEQGAVDVFRAAGLADRMEREGPRPSRDRAALQRKGPPDRDERAHRWPHDHDLRPEPGRGGSRRRPSRGRRRALYEVSDVSLHDLESDRAHDPVRAQGRERDARVRRRRGLRRLPRRQPRLDPGRRRSPSTSASTRSAGSGSSPRSRRRREELIYAYHERGFALHSLRSPKISRLYIQVAADEDVEAWSDDRIWAELHARLATRRRLDAAGGAGPREGNRTAAELRRRADASRASLPRGRRGAHRAADRREGAQPRRRRRDVLARGDRRLLRDRQQGRTRRVLATRAFAASGRASASAGR